MNGWAKSSLLLFFFSLWTAAILVTHTIRTRTPAPAPHQLYSIVSSQLAAFRAADFSSAYCYAASGVQHKFSLPQFAAMIRHDYAEMARAEHVEFGSVKIEGANAAVQVFFFDPQGNVRGFLYTLIAEDNVWKIEGVDAMPLIPAGHRLAGLHI